ncbi:MAG TPA: ornithine carbamoyltransferase [Candidatus Polarisedimenticolaceae bacterium]|nr:ornithine carbamoyltransferase [Candidatus Polarisedimenticolaceae bacterium]
MPTETLTGRDFVSMLDYGTEDLQRMLEVAGEVKANPDRYARALAGKTLFMYFEKPSLRTRVTFEAGMTQLGGHAIYYTAADGRIGVRESVEDVARNLERWVDGAMCRTFSHELVRDLARLSRIPVINGLTDHLHPCQALADYLTLLEVKGDLPGRHLAYVGDGNNVAHSLMEGGARLGVHVTVVHPEGFAPDPGLVEACRVAARETGARITVTTDREAVRGADAVYTDVWASMGQEAEAEARKRAFAPYQVNAALMAMAGPDAVFMHCLPAHRGDEVTDEVADAPQSVIFQEAENRLHAQKAVMLLLMGTGT